MALVAAVGALASPIEKKQNSAIDDVTILNYALTLEHLENAFYSQALNKMDAAAFESAGFPAWVRNRFAQICEHEASHVALLSGALGSAAVQPCEYSFPYTDPASFIALSAVLESVGVSAYLGAAASIVDKTYLTVAGSILTTEARHQTWVSSAAEHHEGWSGPFDTPVGFNVVYSAASAFITSCPASNPALPFKAFPPLTYDAATGAVTGASDGQYIALYQGLNIATYPVQGGKVTLPMTQGTAYITATSEKNATLVSDDNIVAGPAVVINHFVAVESNPAPSFMNSYPSSNASPELFITLNAPSTGEIDGIKGQNFIVDITIQATNAEANKLIPFKPLFQDANSTTFGPGPNAAFPGLVILQNTTANKGLLKGPMTNLAGLFQLNGVAKVNGLNEYNTIWQAGAPLFGIGASELVVYYVNGTAATMASASPSPQDGLLSNVVATDFTISNRTSNTLPSTNPSCVNGVTFQTMARNDTAGQTAVQIFHPLPGDIVGVNGSGFIIDIAIDASSPADNQLLTAENGYSDGFVGPTSPFFKPGPDQFAPGLVVLFNTTMDDSTGVTPFRGPGTNLAGLFQVNVAREINCGTIEEIWNAWLVGKPVLGHGPSQLTVFVVNGVAPTFVDQTTIMGRTDLISMVQTVDFVIS
ncbi:hypothetical protein QFC21_003011 [Naganishia friedmannii]|uniref:Uncharacterized protein n=1 Tax=Naganishia friedmannii TaxID=89922 RepID=A0ACC2VRD6_9TREE|nr:hypothetical protein QFC21_003011 [Naganishia friedmannii]